MNAIQAEPQKRSRLIVFVPVLLICLVMLTGAILCISHVSQPELRCDLDLTAGSFSLADGTQVLCDPDGSFPIPEGETLYIRCPLPDVYEGQASLLLSAPGVDAALLVDGQLRINPSGRFDPESGFPKGDAGSPAADLSGAWTLYYQPGSQLTVAVQFLTVSPSLDALPQIILSSGFYGPQDEPLGTDIWTSLLAGMFLAAGCILLFVFLLMFWLGFPDGSILLLAATAMALCINRLALCSNDLTVTACPELILLAKNLTAIPLMWLLWVKLKAGLLKKVTFLPLLASTGVMSAALFLHLTGAAQLTGFIDQMRNRWMPLGFFVLLLAGIIDAFRHNVWYRKLFPMMGCVLLSASAGTLLLYLLNGRHRITLAMPMSDIVDQHTLFPLQSRLAVLIIFACFLLAIRNFIRLLVERDRELQISVLNNRLASEHAEALYRTLLETRSVRHEIRGRTEALRILCEEGDFDRVKAYVQQLCDSSQITPGLYSANLLVNSLVAPRLQAAQDAGIQVNAVIQVPEKLGILDIDLSTLLVNVLDNAVVAASAVPDPTQRRLTLRMELQGSQLHLLCRNSYTGQIEDRPDGLPASRRGEWHGYGIRLVRRVAEKYNGILDIQHDDSCFTVRAVLLLNGTDS